ncbi:MAG: 2Fe-2S iron-sulfur cluster binding domain-containing protein, partial [Ignavibacteriaceae bacterium]
MSVELFFNNKKFNVKKGSSLFDYAESFGIRVPTSCQKQGKCKECLVEIIEGMECLSEPVQKESHLNGNFRLSCRTKIIADSGVIRC